jgi:hypothetical protein
VAGRSNDRMLPPGRIDARKGVKLALVLGVPFLRLVDDACQLLDRIDIAASGPRFHAVRPRSAVQPEETSDFCRYRTCNHNPRREKRQCAMQRQQIRGVNGRNPTVVRRSSDNS